MNILKLKNNIFKILIELFIFDKIQRIKIKSRWAKKHLKKYIDIAIKEVEAIDNTDSFQPEEDFSDIIWQYWHQGKENAPMLIKKCFESVKRYHPDKKIIILNFENVKDYVKLPQIYYDLVNHGKMKLAFFSDMVRTYLLNKYGGTWIDSTIFLTGKIPSDIFESKFFVLSKNVKTDRLENNMSNFFIHACANTKTLQAIQFALNEYWKENDFAINYFMYEHIATILSNTQICQEEWKKMPYYSAEDTGILQKIIFDDFNLETLELIKQKTNIHKLSYKILRDETSGKSYYDKIINNELK